MNDLYKLPHTWYWTSLGQCFEVHVGATPSRKESSYWGGNIAWVSSGEVRFCRITETREYITHAGLRNSSTQVNPVGSVLIGMIGEGKTRGQVATLGIEACNNQNSAAIWVSQTQVYSLFIYYWLWSQYDITRKGSSGNNQPALNKVRVEQIMFPLPPLAEQEQIVSLVEERLSLADALEKAIENGLKRAERERQSILHQAFTGQLVPQNPDDEPASVLLERIHKERIEREKQAKQSQRTHHEKKAPNKRRSVSLAEARPIEFVHPELIDADETVQGELWQGIEA